MISLSADAELNVTRTLNNSADERANMYRVKCSTCFVPSSLARHPAHFFEIRVTFTLSSWMDDNTRRRERVGSRLDVKLLSFRLLYSYNAANLCKQTLSIASFLLRSVRCVDPHDAH